MADNRKKRRSINNYGTARQKLVRRLIKIVAWTIGILILLVAGLFTWLTITEYKPADVETVAVEGTADPVRDSGNKGMTIGENVTIMTWNVGYGALGDNADFFMDGGKGVKTADVDRVMANLKGIGTSIRLLDPDIVFLQEVDKDSARSYEIDEADYFTRAQNTENDKQYQTAFAYNYKVKFVPYPLPPIGKVNGGILTLSDYELTDSERRQLPCPFSWPYRLGNLKRCLLVSRTPVYDTEGNPTGKELVLVNLHLEAYDSGEGKAAQTAMLKDFLQEEYDKGNYVIAGGDFNQTFTSVDTSMYPEQPDRWHCGSLDTSEFSDDFEFVMDNQFPTCRSLDQSYADADKENFQYYMIDGFIVSKNVSVNVYNTIDLQFECTDHNPVIMSFTLGE